MYIEAGPGTDKQPQLKMEIEEEVVIVGAGVAGLATCLGLHRLGIRSLVLESAETLRLTGFAFGFWTNAWKALEALGVADPVRDKHQRIRGYEAPQVAGSTLEVRCVNRKVLLEILEKELPRDTIRYSSKLVDIQVNGPTKSLLLADGTVIKARVVIGADGVNSAVSKLLGLSKPVSSGRFAIRGFVYFEDGHGFEIKFMQFLGNGTRYGVIPADDHSIYWFCAYTPGPSSRVATDEKEMEHDPSKLKDLVLQGLGNVTDKIRQVFEKTDLNYIICTELRYRHPWELLWGKICKDNVCVIGDALHPMTPDLGQGACCALEDSVVLARCLGEALKEKHTTDERIKKGIEKFAKERRWRSFEIISLAYLVGRVQQGGGTVLNFVRGTFLGKLLLGIGMSKAGYDCGKLASS